MLTGSRYPAPFLAVRSRDGRDWGEYPGLDLTFSPGRISGQGRFLHRDGTPW